MGDGTKIEWTDATWNPIVGCSRVSPGCDHCYAIGVAHRGMSPQHRGLTIRRRADDGSEHTDWNGRINVAPDSVWEKPLRWRRPRRVFVNSLSDLFHPQVDDAVIARAFAVMALAPQHTFQVLTKRPQRMAKLLNDRGFRRLIRDTMTDVASSDDDLDPASWPLPNVWLGVSIESDRYTFRADHLRATPAAVRWISAEPLLGPLPSLDLTDIDWVVAGGESGPGARPMHPGWVRDLRDRCTTGAPPYDPPHGYRPGDWRGPAFLFKQWGDWGPAGSWGGPDHHVSFDGRLWPPRQAAPDVVDRVETAAIHRFGKKAAGRTLDGRTWDEYPEARRE